METDISGPGTLTFNWRVSSEFFFDVFRVLVDGEEIDGISGDVDWVEKSIDLGSGKHTIRWVYEKDISQSEGEDAAFLDNISFAGEDSDLCIPIKVRNGGIAVVCL